MGIYITNIVNAQVVKYINGIITPYNFYEHMSMGKKPV